MRAALALYQWNVEMSAAVYKMLHLVVVGVIMLQLKAARRVLREIEPAAEMWLVSHQQVSSVAAQRPDLAPEMPDGPLSEN